MKKTFYLILAISILSFSKGEIIAAENQTIKKTTVVDMIIDPIVLRREVINNTIKVSEQSGISSYLKLQSAFEVAKSGDLVLLDIDVLYEVGNGPLTINKEIIFRGASKANGQYKIERPDKKGIAINTATDNFKIDNILFVNAFQQLCFKGTHKNSVVINCSFKGAGYTGIDCRGKFTNYKIIDSNFEDSAFSLQTFDCDVLDGFRVEGCTFKGGDHQLSLDNPNSIIEKHENIIINKCTFEFAKRFNIALANTHNVIISNSTMKGGTGVYSQAIHIEDKSSEVMVYKNSIICKADVAILLFTTDKFGHGQGERLTEAEKLTYGSGNVTLNGNYIESGVNDSAITVGYGQGYLQIKGNNTIVSGQKGINTWNSISNGMTIEIEDAVIIKGKSYKNIKKLSPTIQESYLKLK